MTRMATDGKRKCNALSVYRLTRKIFKMVIPLLEINLTQVMIVATHMI